MGGKLRVYRSRMRSVNATKKITRAFELIAASRMVKARQRMTASEPYAQAITRAVSAVATYSNEQHPLTQEKPAVKKAAVLLITADRGLAGSYSSAAIKESEQLISLLRGEGKSVDAYLFGRKGVSFYNFRKRAIAGQWTGQSDAPTSELALDIAEQLIDAFKAGSENGGVDEIHVVYTRFKNMVTQTPEVIRMLPLEIVQGAEAPTQGEPMPLYEFEPSAKEVLDELLPKYVGARIFNALLQSAASELAARQRAMKSATDNAEDLIRTYTRLANTARQAEITQEISEIVGGANALADVTAAS